MSKRELIIILFASAIGVYGLLDYFVISGKILNGEEKIIADAMREVDVYATQTRSKLADITSQKEFSDIEHLILKAEANWLSDPFIEYKNNGEHIADQDLIEEELAELLYTGFIKAGVRVLAIINGMEYKIGELLKDVGYKVSKISSSRVILLTEANKEIILQLKEN